MVALDTRLRPNDDQVIGKVLDGEAIVINLATGSYYAMPDVGAVVWQAIEDHCSVQEIAIRVSATHEVSVERAGADVLELAERLMTEGVVALATGAAAPHGAPVPAASRAPYVAPQLTAYSDMRNLLALDPPMPSIDALAGAGGKSNLRGSNQS